MSPQADKPIINDTNSHRGVNIFQVITHYFGPLYSSKLNQMICTSPPPPLNHSPQALQKVVEITLLQSEFLLLLF